MSLVWGMPLPMFTQKEMPLIPLHSSHSTNTRYGAVQNVYNIDGAPLSAGGSSGGSAVAVATGQCYA